MYQQNGCIHVGDKSNHNKLKKKCAQISISHVWSIFDKYLVNSQYGIRFFYLQLTTLK